LDNEGEFASLRETLDMRKLLVVWDGLPAHRARLVSEFIAAQRGRLAVEWLPAYAPELNPVEYIWGYCKHHELPDFCPHDFAQLSYQAHRALRRMRRRPNLVRSFWQQAHLPL
jgi:transposase